MPTVVIDCRFAGTPTGLGRYTRELTTHLLQRTDPWQYVLLVRNPQEEWLRPLSGSPKIVVADVPHYSLAEQMLLPGILRRTKADLLFSPHFNVPLSCPIPFVTTIHDLILHRFPNRSSPLRQWAYQFLMKRSALLARSIIAVSNFTASEIRQIYDQEIASKITVIPQGVGEQFRPASHEEQDRVRKTYALAKPFFLYVGNAKEHKNVSGLIEALRLLQDSTLDLVLVTGGREAESLTLSEGIRWIPSVPDADLPALYSAARAFVTASLYEGFGLPIAEAAACECPVIASNRTAIPEVAPPDAILLEPTVDAFTEAMRSAPSRRQPVPQRSWVDAAAKTADVLAAALRSA